MRIVECLLTFLCTYVSAIKGQCTISVKKGLPSIEPLILHPDGSGFLYPNRKGYLEFLESEEVRLVCNGEGNGFSELDSELEGNDIIAECVEGNTFKVFGTLKEFHQLGCTTHPFPEQKVNGQCLGSYTKYEIGFSFGNNEFEKLIEVCHDPEEIVTYYTKFQLVKQIRASSGRPGISFRENPHHAINYAKQYNRAIQIQTLGRILGSSELGREYIKEEGNSFLARGHLAANADFIYDPQKRATFFYINQAPQWQRCNANSWSPLERAIRSYADAFEKDLIIYTGVHGVAQLPDVDNVKRDLYLYVSDDGSSASVPVPKFFWKIVYDKMTQEGIAFVQVNDGFSNVLEPGDVLCKNPVRNTKWDITEKWSCPTYVCTIDDLRRKIKTIPKFKVNGLLG